MRTPTMPPGCGRFIFPSKSAIMLVGRLCLTFLVFFDTRMANKKRLTKSKLIKEIEGSFGLVSAIAKRCGVTSKTIYNYISRYPDLQEYIDNEREKLKDKAQSTLVSAMTEGGSAGVSAAKFWLASQHGWSEKQQIEQVGTQKQEIVIRYVDKETNGNDRND